MRTLLLTITTRLIFSCKKENAAPGKTVEIDLLKSFQLVTGQCRINPSTATLQDTVAIGNNDIQRYSITDHTFTLNFLTIQRVKAFRDFTPFAVTVDKQVVYYGIFKSAYSGASCDNSITMSNIFSADNKIVMQLGYPGMLQGTTVEDQRNNPKLIATLRRQGKIE
ncbi:hypothetical protein QWZ08_08685 [Ferruginibacter paludis]|uniref:hypothetical protein n=1 Tax=Ferruginibacter paludis TaxID=1310417 RepID=UPI0025B4370B|nr:hypothetical protein [Ferruginibacter paludis]MDN3655699.1 hypothetical protein [Ferruginibacter paludis]